MSRAAKLNPAAKKTITRDWHEAFPSLGVFKPMWLLKRHGPLLVGMMLDRTSSNDVYVPHFHVHNLLVPSPAILLSLIYSAPDLRHPKFERKIKVSQHAEDYSSAVEFFKQATPELESPHLDWPQIARMHCDFIRKKRDFAAAKYCRGEFRDVILLAHWFGDHDYATECFREAAAIMEKWTPPVDVAAWRAETESLAQRETMEASLQSELVKHKLSALPTYEVHVGDGSAESVTRAYVEAWA